MSVVKYINPLNIKNGRIKNAEFKNEKIRHENEIEFHFDPTELQAVQEIIETVLKCPKISSYERRRSHYESEGVHITLDEFPFGLMLEFEADENIKDAEERLKFILAQFGLNIQQASTYSCDDMYRSLCLKKKKQLKQDILFNDPDMPYL